MLDLVLYSNNLFQNRALQEKEETQRSIIVPKIKAALPFKIGKVCSVELKLQINGIMLTRTAHLSVLWISRKKLRCTCGQRPRWQNHERDSKQALQLAAEHSHRPGGRCQ